MLKCLPSLFFSFPAPLSQLFWEKNPTQALCHPHLGSQHPVLSRAGLFTHLPAAVPTLLPRARLPPFFFGFTVKGCLPEARRGGVT